jgi:hypothetical protein
LRGRLRQKALSLPIIYRIAIGNAIVIAIGAVGGTLLTRHLANRAADLWLILLFLLLGTTLSVITNFVIIKSAPSKIHRFAGSPARRAQPGTAGPLRAGH